MHRDKVDQGVDSKIGECHDALIPKAVDPDLAILLVHFVGDIPQPRLVLTEHFGDAGDGVDVVDLVDRGQGQAAAATTADAACVQFHGSISLSR